MGLAAIWAAALPRLRAEEAMTTAEAIAIGTGAMTKEARRSILAAWRQQAAVRPARPRPATSRDLAGMGIAVHRQDGDR